MCSCNACLMCMHSYACMHKLQKPLMDCQSHGAAATQSCQSGMYVELTGLDVLFATAYDFGNSHLQQISRRRVNQFWGLSIIIEVPFVGMRDNDLFKKKVILKARLQRLKHGTVHVRVLQTPEAGGVLARHLHGS